MRPFWSPYFSEARDHSRFKLTICSKDKSVAVSRYNKLMGQFPFNSSYFIFCHFYFTSILIEKFYSNQLGCNGASYKGRHGYQNQPQGYSGNYSQDEQFDGLSQTIFSCFFEQFSPSYFPRF